jgi:hypothetical protein
LSGGASRKYPCFWLSGVRAVRDPSWQSLNLSGSSPLPNFWLAERVVEEARRERFSMACQASLLPPLSRVSSETKERSKSTNTMLLTPLPKRAVQGQVGKA